MKKIGTLLLALMLLAGCAGTQLQPEAVANIVAYNVGCAGVMAEPVDFRLAAKIATQGTELIDVIADIISVLGNQPASALFLESIRINLADPADIDRVRKLLTSFAEGVEACGVD